MRAGLFAEEYHTLLDRLLNEGPRQDEVNERTGKKIRMLYGAHSFKVSLNRLPVAGNRRYFPKIAAAETAWQIMGTQDPDWILAQAPKLWSNFVEDGKLKTAYGYRWRKHFGRDQLQLAMDELESNPTNRQLWISAWDPSSDGLGGPQPKNIPCPVGFGVTRTGSHLHMAVTIRSSDVFVGLPYDVMGYALTADAIAAETGLIPATLHVTLVHPHLYHAHLPHVEDCMIGPKWNASESWKREYKDREDRRKWTEDAEPQLPGWTVRMIESDPDQYVEHVARLGRRVNNSDWSPLPELMV